MRRSVFITFILVLLASPAAAAEDKTNILIIMADDLTYLDLPVHGGEQVETPNIDRLANEGLTFDQAYVSEARLLETLKEAGQAENTLVLFTSEQGAGVPGAKWTCWNPGVHTSLIARWPGKIDGGQRTDALVQYVDVLPTMLDVAGGNPEDHNFDGTSFLPVLMGHRNHHRAYAYFMHNNVPEGPPYPIRGVTDGEYHYIRNLTPDSAYLEKHIAMGKFAHKYWFSWIKKASTGSKRASKRLQRFMSRPAEELYFTPEDPHNMNNLARDSKYDPHRSRLSEKLDEWMKQQGDPGRNVDTERQLKKARNKEHFQPRTASDK